MTFGDQQTDTKIRCAISNDSSLDSSIRQWLNLAQQTITRRFIWPFLETEGTLTTTSGTETYSLASDVLFLYLMRDTTNDQKLSYISLSEFYRTVPDPSATGVPTLYRLPGNSQSTVSSNPTPQVALYPIPGGAYTIKYPYYKQLSDLSNTTDISQIPIPYHELMVDYACSIYFERQGDTRAVAHMDRFENGLKDMSGQLGALPIDRINVLGSSDSLKGLPVVRFPSSFGSVTLN